MPTYLTITATAASLDVVFNDLETHPDVIAKNFTFKRSALMQVSHYMDPEFITVTMWNGKDWQLNLTGADGGFPVSWVDLGDGNGQQTPTDMDDLENLIKQLLI